MVELLENRKRLNIEDKYYANFDELHIKTD